MRQPARPSAAQGQPVAEKAPSATVADQAPSRPSPTGSFQVFPDQAGAEDEFATSGDVENLLRDIGVVQSSDPLSGVSELLSSVGISLDPPAPEEKPPVEVQDVGSFIGSAPPAAAADSDAFSLESVFGPAPEPPAQAVPPAAEAAPRPAPAPEPAPAPAPEPFDFTSIFRTAEVPAPPGPVQAAAETPTDPLLQSIFGTGPLAPQMSMPAAVPAAAPEPEAAPGPAPVAEPAPMPESLPDAEPASAMGPEAPAAAQDMPAPEIPAVPEAGMAATADDTLPVLESIFSFSTGEAEPSTAPAEAAGEAAAAAETPPAPAEPAASEPAQAEPAASEAAPEAAGPDAPAGQGAAPAPSVPEQACEPVRAGDVSLEVVFGETPAGAAEPAPEPASETVPEPASETAPEPASETVPEPAHEPAPAPADVPAEESPVEAQAGTAPGLVPALFEIHAAGPDELTRVDLIEGSLEVKLAYITGMDSSISVIAEDRRRLLTGTGTIVLGQASRTPVILDIAPGDLVRSDRLVLHDAGMVFSDASSGILPSMVRVGGEGGWALAFTGGRSAVQEPGEQGLSVRAACIVQMQQGITAEADPESHGFIRLSGGGTVLVST